VHGDAVFLHDMVVKEIDGVQTMLVSYWDGGYAKPSNCPSSFSMKDPEPTSSTPTLSATARACAGVQAPEPGANSESLRIRQRSLNAEAAS